MSQQKDDPLSGFNFEVPYRNKVPLMKALLNRMSVPYDTDDGRSDLSKIIKAQLRGVPSKQQNLESLISMGKVSTYDDRTPQTCPAPNQDEDEKTPTKTRTRTRETRTQFIHRTVKGIHFSFYTFNTSTHVILT
eukprot:162093_1